MLDLTVIILTFNEEIHIRRCIESITGIAKQIIIVDSESTDKTVDIAKSLGAEVYSNKWPGNQAAQFNWALDNIDITGSWIFRLDADEYPSTQLLSEIQSRLPEIDSHVSGIVLPLANIWMGKELRHGATRIGILRIFRTGYGRYGARTMDEHIEITEGEIINFERPFVDDNLNNFSWWTNKHIGYAIREAAELLDLEYNLSTSRHNDTDNLCKEAQVRRLRKEKYARQPLFWRAFAYFIFRYFVKGGFLDGKEGFLRHFLQGWWYRTLVDANIYQIKKRCENNSAKIKKYLADEYNIHYK